MTVKNPKLVNIDLYLYVHTGIFHAGFDTWKWFANTV